MANGSLLGVVRSAAESCLRLILVKEYVGIANIFSANLKVLLKSELLLSPKVASRILIAKRDQRNQVRWEIKIMTSPLKTLHSTSSLHRSMVSLAAISFAVALGCIAAPAFAKEPVSYKTFVRAETDRTMKAYVDQGGFGKFLHIRQPTPLDKQDVIRMNLDTLYSLGVFDLTTPVTIKLPESDGRFMSALLINQDHSMLPVEYAPAEFTLSRELMGTRYAVVILRTFNDATNPEDIKAANALQDAVTVVQEDPGAFEVPDWDLEQLETLRKAVNVLAATATDSTGMFGDKAKLDPVEYLLGAAYGWGGNPKEGALYIPGAPEQNDGKTAHTMTITDEVPVDDGFVSITVYNKEGYMEPNDLGVNSINNVTAVRNDDGSVTVNAGGCEDGRVNCVPVTEGWNYIVRMYRPGEAALSGEYSFPEFEVAE